jgi:DNA repair exonuclease SbcCD ATPase subunit
LKIIKLTAENVKKIRAIEITPTGDVVTITGKNGAGKTSVLDAIWWALTGTKHIQAAPIRQGQDKARIRLDLGELVVERRFTPKGSALTVESAEGARYTSPQNVLDKLLGALAFDPLEFVGQAPREQFDTLRRLVPLDVDVDKLDGLNRSDYDRRTDFNREAKTLRAQADGILVEKDLPAEPADTEALLSEMGNAVKLNTEIERQRLTRGARREEIVAMRGHAAQWRAQVTDLVAQAKKLEGEAYAMEQEAERREDVLMSAVSLPAMADVDEIRTRLEQAQRLNRAIEARVRVQRFTSEALDAETEAQRLTDAISARETVKAEAIAKAAMPVEGLGFGSGVVTFGGIPFEQASTAEQLRVSIAIAMAANPRLRVLRIKEGSMLDADGLRLVADMAKTHGFQVWLERVDSTGKVGVVIEDGTVVAVNEEATP